MALARIISHSPQCSQALAASLEERGYAVEIVSPDAIPGHPADLELRVETSPDNVLTARVQANNGPRSASLDFVHYLNPPMPDFRCRPEALEQPPLPPPSSVRSPKPVAVERAQTARPEQAPEPVRLVPEATVVLAEETPASSTPSPMPTAPPEPARRSWPEVKIVISRFRTNPNPKPGSRLKLKRAHRPVGWFWRVAATATALLLAASILSLGTLRHRDAGIVSNRQDPGLDAQAQTGQARTEQRQADQARADDESSLYAHLNERADSPLATPAIDQSVVSAIETDRLKGKKSPSTASGFSAASSVKSAISRPLRRRSRAPRADVVAPNTITYFNRPGAKPTLVKPLPQHPVRSQKPDSVVAARSVAALNAKADPKAGSSK
jgi:hypothetical protein